MIIVQCRNRLHLLKFRLIVLQMIAENINRALHLIHDIKESSILRELNVTGCRFQLTVNDIHLLDLSGYCVEGIDIRVIQSKIRRAEEAVVTRHFDALYMRTEVALSNRPHSLMEHLIGDRSDFPGLRIQLQDRDLAVVVACNKQPGIRIIGREVRASHSVDRCLIDKFQVSAFYNPVSLHTEIRDGIQIFLIVGDGYIGGIGDFHLILLDKPPFLQIHIIDTDSEIISRGSRIGRNVCHVLAFVFLSCCSRRFLRYLFFLLFFLLFQSFRLFPICLYCHKGLLL